MPAWDGNIMKMELLLDAKGIARASEEVASFLSGTGMGALETAASRLSMENVLLMWQEHFGDGYPASMRMGKRFGKPSMAVSVRGDRFDPSTVNTRGDQYAPIARNTMKASGFMPIYSYRGGCNIITLTRPRPPLSSITQILIALVLGIVVALLGNVLLSEANRTYLLDTIVTPLFDVYLAMLSGLAGPLIFFTVAWGICGIGDVTALGRSGKSLVGKFMIDNGLATIFACLICIPFFSLQSGDAQSGGDFLGDLVEMLIGMLPTNIVTAFAEGNTSQIIIIGVLVGVVALVLGNSCEGVRKGIEELNVLMQFLMEQLCRFIPGFIFIMVLLQVWSGTFVSLATAWIPLLLAVVLIVVSFAIKLVYTCLRSRIPLKKLLSALRPAMLLGLSTASSCAAFGPMVSGCTEELGVGEDQTSFGIPLGMILCQQPTIIMLIVLVMYSMQLYGLNADITWYVSMAVMCYLYSVVAPPVPGGMLVCIGLIFAKLGIPSEAIAMATAFSIIIDYAATCFRVGTIMLEVIESGCELDNIDRSKFE